MLDTEAFWLQIQSLNKSKLKDHNVMFYSIWTNYLPDRPTFGWQPCYWLLKQPFLWGEVLSCYPNMHFHSLRLLRRTLKFSSLDRKCLDKINTRIQFYFPPRPHRHTHSPLVSSRCRVTWHDRLHNIFTPVLFIT